MENLNYALYSILGIYALGSWINYLLTRFSDFQFPGWLKPLAVTGVAGYVSFFVYNFHSRVGDAFVQLYTMLNMLAAQVGRM
jgi:hypothetical protein